MIRRLLIALAACCLLAACSSSPRSSDAAPATSPSSAPPSPSVSPSPSATEKRAGQNCADMVPDGRPVKFTVDGSDLYGLILGTGRTGVVISHMRNDDVCQPAPFAKELAVHGYRVLLFDFAGFGVSPISTVPRHKQVAAAVAALRSEGITDVALVGGSMGATATLAAAPTITPAVKAVVALSPPTVFGDDDALAAVPKLKMPTLYAAGGGEQNYPDNVRQLGDRTPKSTRHSVRIVAGAQLHGLWLTDPQRGDPVFRAEVLSFLEVNAPTS